MEPRKEASNDPQLSKEERKCRFQIVKLEERVAPCNPHLNPQGKLVGVGNCHPYGGY